MGYGRLTRLYEQGNDQDLSLSCWRDSVDEFLVKVVGLNDVWSDR